MAIPLAWGVGALILFMMKGGSKPKPKTDSGAGPNAAPASAAPDVMRIQRALLAMGFRGDGALVVNGREDISTQLALQAYWKTESGGYVPLSYAQLADRLEAELAGKAAPNLNYAGPSADILARVQSALAQLGFNNLDEYFTAKGEFPTDNTATGWAALVARLESEARITHKRPIRGL